MSLQPNATNNSASSSYYYTKEEINQAVQAIENLSTSSLFTTLTVSSITVNPSGSINGAGSISTGTLLANNVNTNSITAPQGSLGGAVFAINQAGGSLNTIVAPAQGVFQISQGNNNFGGTMIKPAQIAFQDPSTGVQNVFAAYAYPNIGLSNVSSINGASIGSFSNNSSFTTASISSAQISSINGFVPGAVTSSFTTASISSAQISSINGFVPGAVISSFTTASISSASISSINNAIVPKYQIVTTPSVSVNVPLAVGSTIQLNSYFPSPFNLVAGKLYDVDIEGQFNFSGAPNPADFAYYTLRSQLSPYYLASAQPQGSSFQNQTYNFRSIIQGNGSPLAPTLLAAFSTIGNVTFTLNRVVVGSIG
jgi:hypothetical protein